MSTPSTVPVLDTSGAGTIATQQPQAVPQAAPQQPAAAPPTPQVDASNPNALGGNTTAPSPIQQGVAAEPVNGPNWGARMLHGILAGLGGSSTTVYQPGPNGTMVATTQPKTQGQQWKTMIAGALSGVAASGAAGSGPGQIQRSIALGAGAGLQRGVQMHQQQQADEQQDFDQTQKAKVTNAQTSLLAQQTMASSFNLARAHVDATNADIDRENTAAQLIQSTPGARDLGVIAMDPDKGDADPSEALTRFVSGNPDLIKQMAQGNIQLVSAVKDNKVVGVHAFVLPQQWGAQKTTKDVTLTTFAKPDKPGDPPKEIPYTIPAGSVTNADAMKYTMANSAQSGDYYTDQFKEDQQNRRTAMTANAELQAKRIEAGAQLESERIRAGMADPNGGGGGVDGQGSSIDQAAHLLVAGKETQSMLSNRSGVKQAVLNRAAQIDPTFDPEVSEIHYQANKKFLTSLYGGGQLGDQVVSMNTFLGHAGAASDALQQLRGVLGNSPLLNKPLTAWKFATGSPEAALLQTYRQEKGLAFSEWGNLQRGDRAAHTLDKQNEDALSDINASPAVSQAALKAAASTAVVRMRSIDGAYTMGPGRALPGGQVTHAQGLLTDESKQVLQNFGMNPQSIYTTTGNKPQQAAQPQTQPQTPGPNTHVFNASVWARANPGKDVNQAIAQAKQANYQVVQ
jgi:hypothetical protein